MINVQIDVRRVQAYIFESNRLAQMRGASRLLSRFDNRAVTLAHSIPGAEIIIGGGGHLEFNVPEDDADKFIHNIRQLFQHLTGLGQHRLAIGSDPDRNSAAERVRAAKGALPPIALEHALIRPCPVCQERPISRKARLGPEEVRRVCAVCGLRQDAAGAAASDLWHEMGLQGLSPSASLSDFAAGSRPAGYVAVMVADGDRIGQRFYEAARIYGRKKTSDQIRNATIEAAQAAAEAVRTTLGVAADAAETVTGARNAAKPPMLPLWIGGDDATIIFPAHTAFEAVQAFTTSFSQALDPVAERCDMKPFTISTGLVIGKASHPMYNLIGLALELQKEAKRRMRDVEGTGRYAGAVDFEVVKASVAGNLVRRRAHTGLRPLLIERSHAQRQESDARDGTQDLETLECWLDDARHLLEWEASRGRIRSLADNSADDMEVLVDGTADDKVRQVLQRALDESRLDTLREIYEMVRA